MADKIPTEPFDATVTGFAIGAPSAGQSVSDIQVINNNNRSRKATFKLFHRLVSKMWPWIMMEMTLKMGRKVGTTFQRVLSIG